jgi:hypothetical protein
MTTCSSFTTTEHPLVFAGVRKYLNATLPNRWIGRPGAADEERIKWPPSSPELTPCDFFLYGEGGYVKEKVFVPYPPLDIDELKLEIRAAVDTN